MQRRKVIIVRILQLLEKYTDENHRLSQQDLIDLLQSEYGIECERKAIGRNLETLKQAGIEIDTSRGGICLITRRFEKSELRLLIDSVLASRYIDNKHSADLIDKLAQEGGVYFSKDKHLSYNRRWDKTPNKSVFFTIEILDEAIAKEKKVIFVYNGYNLRKKLTPLRRAKWRVSPYFLLLHNQRYYLICNEEGSDAISYFRVDRITDIEITEEFSRPIRTVDGYKDIRPDALDTAFPYFLDGKPETVVMRCHKSIFSDLVDWFGSRFTVTKNEGDFVEVTLRAPLKAMEYWALQYGESVEVIAPQKLRDDLAATVKKLFLKYNS